MSTRRKARYRAVTMDHGASGWLYRTAKANLWRCPKHYQLDDLIEDGVICYYVVRAKYPQATTQSHIMSLFMVTFTNHLKRIANKRTAEKIEEETTPDFLNAACPDGDVLNFINKCPGYLRRVFLAIMNRPEQFVRPYERYDNGKRETINDRLCELVGLDPAKYDIATQAHEFLHAI